MRLTVTGLVVRAARRTHLTVPLTRLANPPTGQLVREISTAAAPKDESTADVAFPAQSVSSVHEVDPRKTAGGSRAGGDTPAVDPAATRFKEELKGKNEPNKIIHGHGQSGVLIQSKAYVFDQTSNLSPSILGCIDRQLYANPNHPICITRRLIESVFPAPTFKNHVEADPVVTAHDNFDVLGFPQDHPGRSRTDTYYVDSHHVLRTHTSAHQHKAFQSMVDRPETGYTICADVFRRDSIDRSHFPVFHQMEGAKLWKADYPAGKTHLRYPAHKNRQQQIEQDIRSLPRHDLEILHAPIYDNLTNPVQIQHDIQDVRLMVSHLRRSLELLVHRVFSAARAAGVEGGSSDVNDRLKVRWVEAYFPFTSPSYELEVFWQGDWLELLGCGIVKQSILSNAGLRNHIGWAWGLGIERLAMILFGIPDIRLFWSEDPRFLNQFKEGTITKYEPFSKHPSCYKDVAFWIDAAPAAATPLSTSHAGSSPPGAAAAAGGDATKASPTEVQPAAFHENDVMEIVRDVAGRLAEDVKLVDEFVHPSTGRKSLCYRINYRSLERTLTNDEVNEVHQRVLHKMADLSTIELR